MLQMNRDNELNEMQKQHLVYKLQEQAAMFAQLDVEALVFDSNQRRMGRAKQRLEYIMRFADVISETMALSELFWVLMQLDMERMKNRNSYDSKLDAYRMDSLGCNRRIVRYFVSLGSDTKKASRERGCVLAAKNRKGVTKKKVFT